jgi:SAM-dependent methyltransferase
MTRSVFGIKPDADGGIAARRGHGYDPAIAMTDSDIRRRVADYYSDKLRAHGPTPKGADWSSAESQALRFRKLIEIADEPGTISINDYGCGYGGLFDFLLGRNVSVAYHGFDISEPMIAAARARHAGATHCTFVTREEELRPADYTVASGIFNVKLDTSEQEWTAYVLHTLRKMDAVSRRGFAFNVLSLYSDPEKRRPDLYYADPLFLFDHCRRTFSPRVGLLHDYPLYEFTILARKDCP